MRWHICMMDTQLCGEGCSCSCSPCADARQRRLKSEAEAESLKRALQEMPPTAKSGALMLGAIFLDSMLGTRTLTTAMAHQIAWEKLQSMQVAPPTSTGAPAAPGRAAVDRLRRAKRRRRARRS